VRTRLKVCCIGSVEEAQTAVRLGADALGLVSAMPSGPGVIREDEIARIAAAVPPPIATFLLTSAVDPDAIIEQQRRCRTNTLQLCDALSTGSHARLRAALPGVALVQVIHVENEASVEEALAVAPHVDALLLDSGRPNAETKELGGTGRTHDWALSRTIRERAPVPVFLAGGLRADNVGVAVRQVEPFGVDLCSGVRTDGRLDPAKLDAFVAALRAA
jgi:phosphoribosylanthranilate isomerase